MSDGNDDGLIAGLVAGREDAFAALYDRDAISLFRVAFAMLGSRQDAEDAVQEVFVSLVRARPRLARIDDLRSYLFASVRNAAIKLGASRKTASLSVRVSSEREPIDLDVAAPNGARAIDIDRSASLEHALARLPPEQREVVSLKLDGSLTFQQIAALLGISPNTAAGRYRYALQKLRDAITEQIDGCCQSPR